MEMEGCAKVSPAGEVADVADVGDSNVEGDAGRSVGELTNLRNASCVIIGSDALGEGNVGDKSYLLPSKPKLNKSGGGSAVKPKRKSRSTRRRLNALVNNASLHFSDTDSEGELVLMNPRAENVTPVMAEAVGRRSEMTNPTISVTVNDGIGGAVTNTEAVDFDLFGGITPNRSRRQSYAENLTDCDEIYSSDPDVPPEEAGNARASLMIRNEARYAASLHRETDCEDFSNDEDDGDEDGSGKTIYVPARVDIFADLNGETITTKEGNGPFSIEVRNQLSFDEGAVGPVENNNGDTDNRPITPADTDSEDMDASDEENLADEDAARSNFDDILQDLDVAGTSQVVVTNLDKNEQGPRHRLSVGEGPLDDGSNDGHTDVEDIDNE